MEQYISKLSECQQNESLLRDERDALVRRHERELELLDIRLAAISAHRTQIIEEFKQFLDSPQVATNGIAGSTIAASSATPKLLRAESAEATLGADLPGKSVQTLLTVDTNEKPNSLCSTPSPTYHSASHSPNPSFTECEPAPSPKADIKEASPVKPVEDVKPKYNKSGRTFKFVHRLAMSKSAGSIPSAITVASPTTTQIESMLNKVKENANALDSATLNQCIDLLSSRILKDKETRVNVLATPDIFPDYNRLQPTAPLKSSSSTSTSESKKTEGKSRELSRPAPIRQNAQSESVPTSASESASPKQPSSPKKRIETAEERRRRIEQVLMQSPMRPTGSTLSRSTNSLNEIDLSSSKRASSLRPTASYSRYGNRNKTKIRRNNSLSPLRFCQREEKQRSEERESLSKEDKAEVGEIRRYKSDQNLDSDSASVDSADDSANDAENIETDTNDNGPKVEISQEVEEEGESESQEVDHLLAPSKVAKSQDLFAKALFPVKSAKPLLSKEEIAKTRTNVFKKKQAQSLSQESSRGSESPDSAGGSLRVDYLSHLRHNSASPEQRSRERELSALNNTKKFKTFMNYWENKTNEIIDKKRNYEQWHQNNSVVDVPAKRESSLVQSRSQKVPSPVEKSTRQARSKPAVKTEKPKQSVTSQGIERFSKPVNSNSNVATVQTQPQTAASVRPSQQVKERIAENSRPVERSSFVVPAATVKQPAQPSAVVIPAETKANFEDDHLMQRLRHIQQDIRHRRSKQLAAQQAQNAGQQPTLVQQASLGQYQQQQQPSRPSIQAAKSLDLMYYPLKQQSQPQPLVQPKSAAVRIVQPNGEPLVTKNRIRLIRAHSTTEPDEPLQAAVVTRAGPRSMASSNGHRYTVDIAEPNLGRGFKPIGQMQPPAQLVSESSAPMRSTYF